MTLLNTVMVMAQDQLIILFIIPLDCCCYYEEV